MSKHSTDTMDSPASPSAESYFRALLETAPDAMVIVDQNGRIALVNTQVERLFGYARDELIGGTVELLIPERYRGQHVYHRTQYLRQPKTRAMGAEVDLHGRRKDGSEFPVDISLSPMSLPQGVWTTAAIRDVTDRRRKEQQLRASHARLRELTRRLEQETTRLKDAQAVAHIGSGEMDLRSEHLTWSDEIYRIFEVPPGGLDRYEDLLARIHPDDREATDRAYRKSVESHVPYSIVHRIVMPDGRIKHVCTRGSTFCDDQGRPLRSVGTIQDITESMEREHAVQESETRYRRLFETAQDGILLIDDASRRVLDANPYLTDLIGYDLDELLDRTLSDLPAFGRSRVADDVLSELAHADYARHEARIVAKDGHLIDVECISNRYCVGGDAVIQCNIRDITARKETERSLERLNRVRMVLSDINTLIVRSRSRQELFRDVCRIAVEVGGFRLAWIGLVEQDGLRPVASHGVDEGYLDGLVARPGATCHERRAPAVRACRDRTRVVVNDIEGESRASPWRDAALARGFRSVLAYPLVVGDEVVGVLDLYAPEPGFFDEGELKLLDVLAGDIVYAMEFIWNREQIDYLAYYDPLTRLANRRLFSERVEQFVKLARRDDTMVAVLILDLAHFKSVNDAVGAAAADRILEEMGRRVAELVGGEDQVARLGGDLFAAVVPQLKDAGDLSALLRDSVRDHLCLPFRAGESELRLSVKIGIAVSPTDGSDAQALMRHAESALKHAKEAGEPYMFYAHEMSETLKQKLNLDSELRRAVEQREFVLHYQPKVDLETGAVTGVEALLRWRHPTRGLLRPSGFVPLLEKSGLIVEVGRWVLGQAVADYRRWRACGLRAPRIAVNVSAAQLRQSDFVARVAEIVGDGGPPEDSGIELEITESMLMADMAPNFEKLNTLRELGVTATIDDFGTGHSSLAYLARLPVDTIKIDRSFISGMVGSPDIRNIVATIVSLAHSLNLRVVAEGVESPEQVPMLRALRCDEAQGYLFNKALPEAELAELLRADKHYRVA